jgi:hypothetical protein
MSFILTRLRKKLNGPPLEMTLDEQQWWVVERRSQAWLAMRRSVLPTVALVAGSFIFGKVQSGRAFDLSDVLDMAVMSAIFIGLRWITRAGEVESMQVELLAARRLREELLRPDAAPGSAARSFDGDNVA